MVQIAIDGEWYDLEKWAEKHPGGKNILELYKDSDATAAFYSLHSDKAVKQLKLMRPIDRKKIVPTPNEFDKEFGNFRDKLRAEGWFDREPLQDARMILTLVSMLVWGTVYSYTYPLTAMLVIGVAMQQAGWLGHDMVHAKNSKYCAFMAEWLPGWTNGFDKTWWSRKHNTHHVMTNHVGVDPDIDMMPVFFLLAPSKAWDNNFRQYQHFYALPAYSFLFVLWRYNSLSRAIAIRDYNTLVFKMLPGYIWLGCLPAIVSVGSVMIGGLLVALVVVQSHEDEEMFHNTDPGYAMTQFKSTSDIVCSDPVTEYLFGGMQYQLTHHLFPLVPRYKYPKLRPIIVQWAKEHGVEYKMDGVVAMTIKHFAMLRRNGFAAVDEKTPGPGWSESSNAVQVGQYP